MFCCIVYMIYSNLNVSNCIHIDRVSEDLPNIYQVGFGFENNGGYENLELPLITVKMLLISCSDIC